MSDSVKRKLEELDKTIHVAQEYKIKILSLSERFPDLELHTGRWNRERLVSKEVNSIAEDCDIGHSCGCCSDAVVLVFPYVTYQGYKIYSNPASIGVGEEYSIGTGQLPWDNWEQSLKNHNVSDKVIEVVRLYFENNPPLLDEEDLD
jgi:hypothetical protein